MQRITRLVLYNRYELAYLEIPFMSYRYKLQWDTEHGQYKVDLATLTFDLIASESFIAVLKFVCPLNFDTFSVSDATL